MNLTPIEWSDFSSNPLKYRDAEGRVVWGCVHASPGCKNCYAEAQAHRYKRGGPFNVPTMNGLTPFLDDEELHHMLTAKVIGGQPVAGSRCFVGDMTDLFGNWVPDELLDQLFAVFALRPDVTFQVLTKRAERLHAYGSSRLEIEGIGRELPILGDRDRKARVRFPLPNVWLGVSVENQASLERIDFLKDTPARVRFVSFEPLLEDLGAVILDGIQWAIIGGESGPRARPCSAQWVRSLLLQCEAQGVAPFVKQLGSKVLDRNDAGFDGSGKRSWPIAIEERDGIEEHPHGYREEYQGADVRVHLQSRKGSDPQEWPRDLRVREWPK